MSFHSTVQKIREAIGKQSSRSRAVGDERQRKVIEVLRILKTEGKIKDFLETGKFSYSDVQEGIDCYAVLVGVTYKTVPLSITGPFWVEDHRKRHPEIPIVSVDLDLGSEALVLSIREQLAAILAAA